MSEMHMNEMHMNEKSLEILDERHHYTVREKSLEEANKLYYDVFKHLTTLSTGSILLLATFLGQLFSNPQWKFLVALSLASFIVSIVSAVLMMFWQAGAVLLLKQEIQSRELAGFLVTVISFLLGIISFVTFAIRNFYI
jgi:hypothetical protein